MNSGQHLEKGIIKVIHFLIKALKKITPALLSRFRDVFNWEICLKSDATCPPPQIYLIYKNNKLLNCSEFTIHVNLGHCIPGLVVAEKIRKIKIIPVGRI